MKKLLDHDAAAGITRVFHYDESVDEKNFLIETKQNVDGIIEQNRREFNGADRGFKGDMKKVASIPLTVFMDLQKRGITRDPVAMKRWLNDPDNAAFRTAPGVV
jgi:hypothetical protein